MHKLDAQIMGLVAESYQCNQASQLSHQGQEIVVEIVKGAKDELRLVIDGVVQVCVLVQGTQSRIASMSSSARELRDYVLPFVKSLGITTSRFEHYCRELA